MLESTSTICKHCENNGVTCGDDYCAMADPESPYDLSMCRPCWIRLDKKKREGLLPTVVRKVPPSQSRCLYLGDPTSEMVKCGKCGNRTYLKVFSCDIHGRCTLKTGSELVSCPCPNFTALPPLKEPIVRNLIYHIYPIKGDMWRWNVDELLSRIEVFNGRRIIAVVTDSYTDSPDVVRSALGNNVDEVVVLGNVPELREVNTFELLFSRIKSLHPSHVTFYGHAKGVTRTDMPHIKTWTEILLSAHLDYWPVVEEILQDYPLAGCFKLLGKIWPDYESKKSLWHYSGSFMWFRNYALFSKPDWGVIDRKWMGIESYPSLHFTKESAGVIFCEGKLGTIALYKEDYINGVILPAWHKWQEEHAASKRTSGS
jgi:hypothetical protein